MSDAQEIVNLADDAAQIPSTTDAESSNDVKATKSAAAPQSEPADSRQADSGQADSGEARKLMDAAVEAEVEAALASMSVDDLAAMDAADMSTPTADGGDSLQTATVISIQGDDIFIDTGGRAEGVVPTSHFEELPAVGTKIEVVPERFDADSGLMIFTRKGAILKASWDALQPGVVVEGRCTGMNKGGLELDLNGIRAFMPASQCDVNRLQDISVLIGEKLECVVTEVNHRDKNVLVSRRKLQQRLRKADREKLLAELEVGEVREGTVSNVTDYGAFVNLGADIDGLLHVSDMSYGRVNKPADVVTAGQTVEVKILKFDPKSRKVSLGLKQTMPDPWDQVPGKYTEGQQTTGRVVRLADFGAFVELEAGIDCLVPVSELSWTQRVHRPGDVLKVDQVVTGVILRVEPEKRRISMSLKRIEEDPWALVEEQYPQSTVLKGKVARITEFGAFVEIHPGVDGLVHISELSDQRVRTVSDVVQEGQEVECKVLSVDREARKISLTIKGVHADGAEAIAEEVVTKPRSKRKTPLRGGLESQGGWFIG